MYYSDFEIVTEYKSAKNKRQQIKILAQLNGCHEDTIINTLIENGFKYDESRGYYILDEKNKGRRKKEADITVSQLIHTPTKDLYKKSENYKCKKER